MLTFFHIPKIFKQNLGITLALNHLSGNYQTLVIMRQLHRSLRFNTCVRFFFSVICNNLPNLCKDTQNDSTTSQLTDYKGLQVQFNYLTLILWEKIAR